MAFILNVLSTLQRKIAWLLLFSFFSLCFVGWLIYSNKKNIENTAFWINHTYSVIQQINELDARIPDKASALQEDAAFYQSLDGGLNNLQRLTVDNPDQQKSVVGLLHSLSEIRSGHYPFPLQAVKSTLSNMMQREKDLLVQRRLVSEREDRNSIYMLVAGSVFAFLFIVVILIQLNKDIVLRKAAEEQLLQSESKYRSLIENAGAVIYSADPGGYIN